VIGFANNQEGSGSSRRLEMNFRIADFPSDALSVKRLRAAFPNHFDCPDLLIEGYTNNDFFWPSGDSEPEHLVRLTRMICAERTVASGAFYREYLHRDPELLNEEELEVIAEDRRRLEDNYQFFKLADSPETARLLIQHVEAEGRNQALKRQAKGR